MNIVKKEREKIKALHDMMKEMPQVDCEVIHRFSPGLYLREVIMPAGSVVGGKIHATEHFNIILSGECVVHTTEGVEKHIAPAVFVSKAGVQKTVVNITETRWLTTHVTDKTDLDDIEKDVIAEDYHQLEEMTKKVGGTQ